jgi:CheY-like chemotaxis protein
VFIAENGLEALKKLKILSQVSHPCLVLADFMMPMMDGVTLLKEMQHNDVLSSIPTVMVSANAPPPDVPRFIRKPFQLESILKLLKEFC